MTVGIYKITNKLTGECYVGQSVNIEARYSNHFNRDARRYYGKHKFHTDIVDLGRENFFCEILEVCSRCELLKREQYWYDKLQPSYNIVRPDRYNFPNPEVFRRAQAARQKPEFKEKMKRIHASKEFRNKCKNIHTKGKRKMRPVIQIKNDVEINKFESLSAAGRWIKENTNYKSKNPISKIKSVCDKERKTAYGFKWKYVEV